MLYIKIFILIYSQLATANECKNRIIFLPQTHARDTQIFKHETTIENKDKVIESQFSITKYINENMYIPIFSESASVDKNLDWNELTEVQKKKAREFAKMVFPKGLPNSLLELSTKEKSIFYEVDAASLFFIKEKIQRIYRVISPEDYEIVYGEITKWINANPGKPWSSNIEKLVLETRERLALYEILKFFNKNSNQREVILIFGSNHNFSIYPDLFDPNCVIIPNQFLPIWYGKFRSVPDIKTPKYRTF